MSTSNAERTPSRPFGCWDEAIVETRVRGDVRRILWARAGPRAESRRSRWVQIGTAIRLNFPCQGTVGTYVYDSVCTYSSKRVRRRKSFDRPGREEDGPRMKTRRNMMVISVFIEDGRRGLSSCRSCIPMKKGGASIYDEDYLNMPAYRHRTLRQHI